MHDGSGRCPKHTRLEAKALDERRGTAASRGYGAKWQRAREQYLRENPLCLRCSSHGDVVVATVVDHITPHRLHEAKETQDQPRIAVAERLFWSRSNWQPLCKTCHDRKTATEDGGFGRRAVQP